jgi:hypothetical protein
VPFGADSFRLAHDNEEICRITLDDGAVTVNRKYCASKDAQEFWEAVNASKPAFPMTINAVEILSRKLPAFSDSFRLINAQEELCRIMFDNGEIRVNSKYSVTHVARVFWSALVS